MSNKKPKCRCGNTSDPNGYCDGSHSKQTNPKKWVMKINSEKIVRILLAVILLTFGLNKILNFMPFPPMPEEAQTFMSALVESGYIMYVVAIIEIISGIFLLIDKFSSFWIIVIFPILLNAFLFHLFLDIAGIAGALFAISLNVYLMIKYFNDYKGLITNPSPNS